nr:hypothetical protein [Tanacetum cinerariifolium]
VCGLASLISIWHNYFSSGTGFGCALRTWLIISKAVYLGICFAIAMWSVIELCSAGYKDASGFVSFFLRSFCISVGSVGYKVVPGSDLDGFELYEFCWMRIGSDWMTNKPEDGNLTLVILA